MVQINFAQKEIQCKIVYYGPGMSGKTTNLELIHAKAPDNHRGELTSIATTGERTLYFDYMPLDLGQIAGISTKFQLYTVPGQIYYKSTRRLVLQGVDGIVFVADSSAAKMRENKESLADLEDNLKEMGKTVRDVPIVIQYNKRDLDDAMTTDDLQAELNPHDFPMMEATATSGEGVFPTLKHLAGMVLESVNKGSLASARGRTARRPARQKQTVAAPMAAAAAPAVGRGAAPAAVSTAAVTQTAPPTGPVGGQTLPRKGGGGGGNAHPPQPPGRPLAPPPGSHAPAPEAAPVHAAAEDRSAPAAAARNYQMGNAQDRVVAMSNMHSGPNTKLLVMLGLGVLIAGLVYFVGTQF
jgi:signal recognition particle receptor subunit beta